MKTDNIITFSITENYESIGDKEVFSELLKVLMSYSYYIIGNSSLRLEKNREQLAYDLAMEAITRYLENPNKFDPSRNSDLVKYLKFSILKRLVSNFKELKGQKNELIYNKADAIGIEVMNSFLKENDINESIDLSNTIKLIQKELIQDKLLSQIFKLRYIEDSTRKEICKDLSISNEEYNNVIRRLKTVLNRVTKQQETKNE